MLERLACLLDHALGGRVALAILLACSALYIGTGCRTTKSPAQPRATDGAEPLGELKGVEEPDVEVAAVDYQVIGERDPFRPLVVNRKAGEGAGEAGSSASGQRPSGSDAAKPEDPKPPPDPTEDLALTGITETTDGLEVLVERISTGEGQYARVGDVVFDLKVDRVSPNQVTLTQGDKTFELTFGEKEIAETAPATKPDEKSTPQEGTSQSAGSSSGGPGGPPGGMTDWRNMSEEDRRQAMERRRQWWEGLSEAERNQYRSRMGGGRGGPRGGGRRGR